MWRDFEGGVYWDELADRCGDVLRAAGFRGAARFRGNTVCMFIYMYIVYTCIYCFSKFLDWVFVILIAMRLDHVTPIGIISLNEK